MKQRLFRIILALFALMLTGCEDNRTQEQIDTDTASQITEFNYKGHKYLLYRQSSGYQGYGGIVHNPDCPCHKTNSER